MNFAIHKKPTKVSLLGLAGYALYFACAALFFRGYENYVLILGVGFLGLAMLFVKSIACVFISTYTVTERSIETVTPAGGIIRIRFEDLDPDRSEWSELGLFLVPRQGESVALTLLEYSREDIAKLARHIGFAKLAAGD